MVLRVLLALVTPGLSSFVDQQALLKGFTRALDAPSSISLVQKLRGTRDRSIKSPASAACPNPVKLEYGLACRCTASSCGSPPDPETLLGAGEALVVTSRKGGPFLSPEVVETVHPAMATKETKMNVKLEAEGTHQKILGFGGAVTDATAYHYENMIPALQQQFIRQHYGTGSIGYSIARVPMNAADFSRMDYTHDNVSGDLELRHFCLRDDSAREVPCGTDYKTTVLKAAKTRVEEEEAHSFKIFLSTWSAPLWYKNQNFTCWMQDAMYQCKPGGAEQVAKSSMAVGEPRGCRGNRPLEPCPLELLAEAPAPEAGGGGESTSGTLLPAFLQRASVSPALGHLKRRRRLGSPATPVMLDDDKLRLDSAFDASLQDKHKYTPEHPTKASLGNNFNTGFLSSNASLQASWALYFVRFIEAYQAHGLDIWGLTIQNEPAMTASLWQSMLMTNAMQASFLASHLGPMMRRRFPAVKLMVHDDSLTALPELGPMLDDPAVARYVDGVAYHWYASIQGTYENSTKVRPSQMVHNIVSGGAYVSDVWKRLQGQSEDKFVLMSEACNGYALGTKWTGPRPGEWGYGYSYSHDIMWQLLNGAAGWVDWNLMLDKDGGPNLAGNFVDSPIIFETPESFIQNPSFFHIAHFSKYVLPGSRRVDISITCRLEDAEHCQAAGFRRPDGKVVVVLTNDHIAVGPIVDLPGVAKAFVKVPKLATGHGKAFHWTLQCGEAVINGVAPWQSIQTVVMPCG
mmetsp:Transcript_105883/g.299301  ORF Transcript_105883/g.299301 Transcript_105883/m.299301 type:complete len:743 (-) Transcript_105883:83-2311(-)